MSIRGAAGPLFLLLGILVSPAATAGKVKAQTFEADLEQSFSAAKGTSFEFENLLGSIEVMPQPKGREVRIRAHVVSEAVDAVEARRLAQEVQLVRSDERAGVLGRRDAVLVRL